MQTGNCSARCQVPCKAQVWRARGACSRGHFWFSEKDISKVRPEGDKEVVEWKRGMGQKRILGKVKKARGAWPCSEYCWTQPFKWQEEPRVDIWETAYLPDVIAVTHGVLVQPEWIGSPFWTFSWNDNPYILPSDHMIIAKSTTRLNSLPPRQK